VTQIVSQLATQQLIRPTTTQGDIGDVLKDRIVYDAWRRSQISARGGGAVAEYLRAAADNGESQSRVTALSGAYRASGWKGFLQKQLDLMKDEPERRYITSL